MAAAARTSARRIGEAALSARPGPSAVPLAPADARPLDRRIRVATLRCVARWGVSKTTLDDVAREAGCSRATVYRAFPGGKDALMLAAFAGELAEFFEELAVLLTAAETLEDLLTVALVRSCQVVAGHEALTYLLEHEPEAVLPFVSFDGLDPLLAWSRGFAAPHLGRFLGATQADELAEWLARLVVSYAFDQQPDLPVDLADEARARRFVRTYVLPGVEAGRTAAPALVPAPSAPVLITSP